MDKFFFVVAGI